MAYDVYQAAAALVERRYGMRLLTADEGGLAPPCESAEAMIQTAVEAIEQPDIARARRWLSPWMWPHRIFTRTGATTWTARR